ncbi:hypothetical protein BU24DRAFT_459553 [Aaosphaeria arxii CBS 175.79]|uniref:Mitotic-spindle organizing protein 1 n=1 Tax=Aaosphaeria arxii CBS 175.79 TaxID=1450172 RepID=A0A6A5Y414_9PLEO|nr:uncharacterized protein BU24DRAFT_459553 [Aaosphaeria arxii CBS 175.79]KAF2019933.1 hypothetical protein BU24DRAFT_459553 [Aaosphaeria arxii CBS 175.79]
MEAPQPTPQDVKRKAAREVIDILHEIATLLRRDAQTPEKQLLTSRITALQNTHLDRQQLSYCVSLIENGANPEALAKVIRQLREEYPVEDSE